LFEEWDSEFDTKYPLVEAAVKVEDDFRGPGRYRAIARLRMHGMLWDDFIGVSIRLVLELTPAAGRP
jgi:predicted component of type VI protein secretion system